MVTLAAIVVVLLLLIVGLSKVAAVARSDQNDYILALNQEQQRQAAGISKAIQRESDKVCPPPDILGNGNHDIYERAQNLRAMGYKGTLQDDIDRMHRADVALAFKQQTNTVAKEVQPEEQGIEVTNEFHALKRR